MGRGQRAPEKLREFRTEFDGIDQSGLSALYEITAEIGGTVRQAILEASRGREAEEIFFSIPGIDRGTDRIIGIKRIMHGIYWVPQTPSSRIRRNRARRSS